MSLPHISIYGNLIESSGRAHTVTSWLMPILHISIYENLIESSRWAHIMSLVAHKSVWMILDVLSNLEEFEMTNLVP